MAITTSGTTLTFNDSTTQTTAPVNTNANVNSATAVAGTGISVTGITTTGAATHTITNTGVTSVAAGSGISVSGSTGAVTITNTSSVNTSQLAKVWLAYSLSGQSILSSFGVSSVTYNGTGTITVNFSSAFANTNYATLCTAARSDNANGVGMVNDTAIATGSVQVKAIVNSSSLFSDPYYSVACFSN